MSDEEQVVTTVWQLYDVTDHDPVIGKQIYWTQEDIVNHAAMRPGGQWIQGVEPWDGETKLKIPQALLERYKELRTKKQCDHRTPNEGQGMADKNQDVVAENEGIADGDQDVTVTAQSATDTMQDAALVVQDAAVNEQASQPRIVWHRIWARMQVRITGLNVRIEWELASPSYRTYKRGM